MKNLFLLLNCPLCGQEMKHYNIIHGIIITEIYYYCHECDVEFIRETVFGKTNLVVSDLLKMISGGQIIKKWGI